MVCHQATLTSDRLSRDVHRGPAYPSEVTKSKRVQTRLVYRLHVVQPTVGHHCDVGVPMWRGAI
jgi:hypothetical protein